MEALRALPLTTGSARTVIIIVLVAATAYGLVGLARARTRRATLTAMALAILLGIGVWFLLEVAWRPFPDRVPVVVYISGAAAASVVLGALLQPGRRLRLAVPAVAAVLAAAGVANLIYQQFPTLGSLDPQPVTVAMSYDEFRQTTTAPTIGGRDVGALVTVPLQGTDSGFPARDALAYVPPAYWTHPDRRLPVLVLLAGNPGEPKQWFTAGGGDRTADIYQAAHDGVSPIVVSVDGTGSFTGNPACVDGPELKVDTYLSQEVPALLQQRFRVNPDTRTWTIGGLSYGGTCALQIVSNHPDVYGSFLNFSGQAEPTLGSRERTIDTLFGGDEDAFRAVNPADVLSAASGTGRYAHIAGRFIAGDDDSDAQHALRHLDDLARAAGMSTTYATVPGGHSYQVWRVALRDTFDWVAQRGGLSS